MFNNGDPNWDLFTLYILILIRNKKIGVWVYEKKREYN